jgi:hypothetical protein
MTKDVLLTKHTDKCLVIEKNSIVDSLNMQFGLGDMEDLIKKSHSETDQECKLHNIDYEIIIKSQKVREKVITVLEQQLYGKNSN